MTLPTLALVCRHCSWRPGPDTPMGLVDAHAQTEHGTDPGDIHLDLKAICPFDNTNLGEPTRVEPRGPRTVVTYDCPKCLRTFILTRAP